VQVSDVTQLLNIPGKNRFFLAPSETIDTLACSGFSSGWETFNLVFLSDGARTHALQGLAGFHQFNGILFLNISFFAFGDAVVCLKCCHPWKDCVVP